MQIEERASSVCGTASATNRAPLIAFRVAFFAFFNPLVSIHYLLHGRIGRDRLQTLASIPRFPMRLSQPTGTRHDGGARTVTTLRCVTGVDLVE
jgi:hypothetical protein